MNNAWKRKIAWAGAAPATFLAWLNVAMAQSTGGGTNITLPNPLGGQTFLQVANNVIAFIYYDIAIPLCVVMALIGAFQLMTSAGDPEKASQGRKTLIYTAIGFAVVLIAGGLATLLQNILNGK